MYGMKAFGYQPFGTTARLLQSGNPNDVAVGENMAGEYGRDLAREGHEQRLQQQEQNRRQYDSETARKKASILSGLLGGR
jgi:hypothetical protein